MNPTLAFLLKRSIFAIPFFITACQFSDFSEKQMKGYLTVNLKQMGNKYLEVADEDQDRKRRFIYPGKKIIEIKQQALGDMEVRIMDSRRVQKDIYSILFDGHDLFNVAQ